MTEVPESTAWVQANKTVLRRLLCTLAENAIKYTPPNGEITLGVLPMDSDVEIFVKDNGDGIRSADLPHIFERFYRGGQGGDGRDPSDAPGVGLGLYLVKNLVAQMDGRITVDTQVGRGSTFTIHLPAMTGDDGDGKPGTAHG